jgi:hypothetical protein
LALNTRGPFVIRKHKPWRQQFCMSLLRRVPDDAIQAGYD